MTNASHLLFGYHPVHEALIARRRRIERIYLGHGKGEYRRQAIADRAHTAGIDVQWVAPRQITAMVGHPRHQDVCAQTGPCPVVSLDELLAERPRCDTTPWFLLLDRVVDPQNMGAMARTAQCAGIQGLVLPKNHSAPPSATASKASAGALEHIPLVYVTNLVDAMKRMKRAGIWVAGADRDGDQSVFEADLSGPLALVIGGEEKGLRPLVRKHCDFIISIPQTGPVGSLNASAAAAVVIYESYRQRSAATAVKG
jgi:23S rRNA (guanosine2251-2'-O)-methyltransferase